MDYTAQLNGYKIVVTDRSLVLKYPSGKKDGNKLGKHKKHMFLMTPTSTFLDYNRMIIDKEHKIIYCTSNQYKQIKDKI